METEDRGLLAPDTVHLHLHQILDYMQITLTIFLVHQVQYNPYHSTP